MIIIEHTIKTAASPTDIWKIWQDVEKWSQWDHDVKYSYIDGPFEAGTTGTLKPYGGPKTSLLFTSVNPLNSFVTESKLFLGRLIVSHFLTQSEGKTLITHKIEITGPLRHLYMNLFGRKMKKNLPHAMIALLNLL